MKSGFYGALTVLVIIVAIAVVRLSSDLDRVIVDSDTAVLESQKDITVTAQRLNVILENVNDAAEQAKLAAKEQRMTWNKTAVETDKTARAVRMLIDRTDRSLNDKLLPQLMQQTDNISAASQVSLEAIGHSADTLTLQLNDPHIMSLATHLDESSQHVADASLNLELATEDIKVKVHQMTRPASWAARIGGGILGFGAKAAQIFAGVK